MEGETLLAPMQAQWLNYKTAGIPAHCGGQARSIRADAPRGRWQTGPIRSLEARQRGAAETGKAMESQKPQPWAVALAKKREEVRASQFKKSPSWNLSMFRNARRNVSAARRNTGDQFPGNADDLLVRRGWRSVRHVVGPKHRPWHSSRGCPKETFRKTPPHHRTALKSKRRTQN
jgi:hypothetical protein